MKKNITSKQASPLFFNLLRFPFLIDDGVSCLFKLCDHLHLPLGAALHVQPLHAIEQASCETVPVFLT
jgi:hypothetical protein